MEKASEVSSVIFDSSVKYKVMNFFFFKLEIIIFADLAAGWKFPFKIKKRKDF